MKHSNFTKERVIILLILNENSDGILKALDLIYSGEVIIWPSDGVYTFACNALCQNAVEYIYSLKTRSKNKALPVLANKNKVYDYGTIDNDVKSIIKKYWPGFVALVVPKKSVIPDFVTAGKSTVDLVCPNQLAEDLATLSKVPIAATSANISGKPEALDIQTVMNYFDGKIKTAIDGGKMSGSLTTIFDLTQTPHKFLRDGKITRAEILETISDAKQIFNI
jgi:L-threonylcarbamoyladenylate synthase